MKMEIRDDTKEAADEAARTARTVTDEHLCWKSTGVGTIFSVLLRGWCSD